MGNDVSCFNLLTPDRPPIDAWRCSGFPSKCPLGRNLHMVGLCPNFGLVGKELLHYCLTETWQRKEDPSDLYKLLKWFPTQMLDNDPATPLAVMMVSGNVELTKMMLDTGSCKLDIPNKGDGYTPLHILAIQGTKEMAELFITYRDKGICIRKSRCVHEKTGRTPFDILFGRILTSKVPVPDEIEICLRIFVEIDP